MFVQLYKIILTFESMPGESLTCDYSSEQGIEQCFPLVLFIVLYKVILSFMCIDEIVKYDHSSQCQVKAAGQYFPVVLFITLYKVVLSFVSVDEIV